MKVNRFKQMRKRNQQKKNLPAKVARILSSKYKAQFDFYFSKQIDNILLEERCSDSIQFKDFQIYDLQKDNMRRYYKKEESGVRLKNYSAYYAELEDYLVPNYEKLDARKLMFKLRKRKYKLRYRYQIDPRSSLQSNSDSNQHVLNKLKDPTIYLEDVKENESFRQQKNNWKKFTENFELNLLDNDLFDCVFDVYEPKFSSEEDQSFELDDKTFKRDIFNKWDQQDHIPFELHGTSNSLLSNISDFENIDQSWIKNGEEITLSESNLNLIDMLSDFKEPKSLNNNIIPFDQMIFEKANFTKNKMPIQVTTLPSKQDKGANKELVAKQQNLQSPKLKLKKKSSLNSQKSSFKSKMRVLESFQSSITDKSKNKSKLLSEKEKKPKKKKKKMKKFGKIKSFKNSSRLNQGKQTPHFMNKHTRSEKISFKPKSNLKSNFVKKNLFSDYNLENNSISSYVKKLFNKEPKLQTPKLAFDRKKISIKQKLQSFGKDSTMSNYSSQRNKKKNSSSIKSLKPNAWLLSTSKDKRIYKMLKNSKKERILPEKFYSKDIFKGSSNLQISQSQAKMDKNNFLDEYNYYNTEILGHKGQNKKKDQLANDKNSISNKGKHIATISNFKNKKTFSLKKLNPL